MMDMFDDDLDEQMPPVGNHGEVAEALTVAEMLTSGAQRLLEAAISQAKTTAVLSKMQQKMTRQVLREARKLARMSEDEDDGDDGMMAELMAGIMAGQGRPG